MNFPESIAYKLNLYRGYIAICHPDEQHLNMVCLTSELVPLELLGVALCTLVVMLRQNLNIRRHNVG